MSNNGEEQLTAQIRSGKFSEKELINLYKNASSRGIESLMEAVKLQMRADFPRAASRMFGAKEAEAMARLEEVYKDLERSFDLSANRVGNGVKVGGGMLKGEQHIDVYISYKNKKDIGVSLGLMQDDAASELTARVGNYRTGTDGFREYRCFKMDNFAQAVATYKTQLANLLS